MNQKGTEVHRPANGDVEGENLSARCTRESTVPYSRKSAQAKALAMLGEIYNWFTESFDTADRKKAEEPLREQSGRVLRIG